MKNTRQRWSTEVSVSHEQTEWLCACVCGRLTKSEIKNEITIRTEVGLNVAAAVADETHMTSFDNNDYDDDDRRQMRKLKPTRKKKTQSIS